MEDRALIERASYRPEVLKAMGQALDEAWVQIAGNLGNDTIDAEKARLRLARALLSIAHKDGRDAPFRNEPRWSRWRLTTGHSVPADAPSIAAS